MRVVTLNTAGPSLPIRGCRRIGAAFLAPLAAKRHAFRGVRRVLVPVVVVTVLDLAAPAFLTAWGKSTSVPRWRGSSRRPTPCARPCLRCG